GRAAKEADRSAVSEARISECGTELQRPPDFVEPNPVADRPRARDTPALWAIIATFQETQTGVVSVHILQLSMIPIDNHRDSVVQASSSSADGSVRDFRGGRCSSIKSPSWSPARASCTRRRRAGVLFLAAGASPNAS